MQTTIGQKTLLIDMSATCPTTVGSLFFEERPEKPMQSAVGSGCARAAVCILARSFAKAATTLDGATADLGTCMNCHLFLGRNVVRSVSCVDDRPVNAIAAIEG